MTYYSSRVKAQSILQLITNKVVNNTIEGQKRQILNNIKTIITEAEFSMENVLKVSAFRENINAFVAFNGVYEEFFAGSKPARACIQGGKLLA